MTLWVHTLNILPRPEIRCLTQNTLLLIKPKTFFSFWLFINNSCILSNQFILIRDTLDLKQILGGLGVRWKYMLNGMLIYSRTPCIYIFRNILSAIYSSQSDNQHVYGSLGLKDQDEIYMKREHVNCTEFRIRPSSPELWDGNTTYCAFLFIFSIRK